MVPSKFIATKNDVGYYVSRFYISLPMLLFTHGDKVELCIRLLCYISNAAVNLTVMYPLGKRCANVLYPEQNYQCKMLNFETFPG